MSSSATLVVAGRLNEGFPKDALRTLLSNGFGPIFDAKDPNLDGEFGGLADLGCPIEHNEQLGLILTNGGSASNNFIQVQFNPTADQFRSSLLNALGYVLNNPASSVPASAEGDTEAAVDKNVLVIYAGQVVAPTGEWLLSDSAVSQHLISTWLNAEAAKAWYPQLDRFPHTSDKIHLHLFTPLVGGTGSSWHPDKGGHPQSLLTHVDARLIRLTLSVDASWRLQGKTVNSNDALLASHPGVNSFIQRIIERHPATVLSLASEAPPLCCALSAQNPALYVFPGGGLSTEGSALFALQGFTLMLGGGYTGNTAPKWWKMVRNLPKLDAIVIPDWSSSNLLSYQFIQNLLTDDVEKSSILGELLLPPAAPSTTAEQNDEVTVAPPTALMHSALQMWPSSVTISDSLPAPMSLYSKLGWGELKLQPLGQRAGLVVLWKSLTNNHSPQTPPLTLLLPANPPPGTSPSQGLVKLVKALGTVPVLNSTNAPTSGSAKQTTKAPRAPSSGSRARNAGHVNGAAVEKPERRTPLNSSRPQTAAASSARTPSKPSTDLRRPNAASPSRTPGSTNVRKGTSPARLNKTRPLGASPSRPSTGREKNNLLTANRSQRAPGATSASKPTGARPSQTKPATGASKPTKTTPATSTADRLAAHANLVASKQRPTMRNKANDVTSKATPAAASKTAPFKVNSKTPLNKLSETKEPKEPEPAPPLAPTTVAEKNVPAEPSLTDSLEGSAHEPMMSGWESTKSSMIQPHGEIGEAELPAAELYKVHKFQLLNEADEPASEEGQPVPAEHLNPEEEAMRNLEPAGEFRTDSLDEFEQQEKRQIDYSTEPTRAQETSPTTGYPGFPGEGMPEVGHPEHPGPFGEEGIEAEHKMSPLEAQPGFPGEGMPEFGHPEDSSGAAVFDLRNRPSDIGELDFSQREISLSPSKPAFGESPNPLASPASVVSQGSDADGHSLVRPDVIATTEIAPADQSEQAGTVPADALDDGHAFSSYEAQASAADTEAHPSCVADSTSAATPVSPGTELVSGSETGDIKIIHEPDSAQQQAADSTTEDDHKLPSQSIGFDNLIGGPDQHEVQASIGSPDSQASVHSVVHQFAENGKHETGEGLMSPAGDESPEVTSTEEKTKSGGFSIGFGDENGAMHSDQPGFGGHEDVDAAALMETKPTNGVHSSELSGSLSPSSPHGEFTNGHSHHEVAGFPELPERPKGLYGGSTNPFETDASWSPTHDDGDQQHKVPYPLQSHDELFPKFVHMDPNADNTADRTEHDDGQDAHTFDPTKAWGQPEGLPAPIVTGNKGRPISAPGSRLAGRNAAGSVGIAHGASMDKAHTPTTLPPGPPVYLDLVWVPSYLGRVSHELATEFFARVRARIYVLSGESLHPMIGEAMIEGKAKWGPDDVNILCKRYNENHRNATPESAITILPTDEPYDWGVWLRTPCGRTDHSPGEQRLEASGFRVLPSASCQDIDFSTGTQTVRCEGVRLEF